MKRHFPLRLAVLSLATLSASALADVVTLKNGSKIEGKITAETDAQITLSVKAGGIIDEQIVKKSDVASVVKDAPDEVAWQQLKNVRLGKNSFPAASYETVINPLNGFLNEYPQSKFAADAKKLADTFSEEKKRVDAGEVKLDDKWLSKEDTLKEGIQIKGLIAFNFMKDQAARDMTAAMNTFDAIEKNYSGTRSYPDAVEYAQKMLPALKAEVDRRAKALAAQKTEQTEAVKKLTGVQKTAFENELKTLKTNAEAVVDAAAKQGLKWPPLNPATEKSLQSLTTKIPSETLRLGAMPVATIRASFQAAEKAKTLLAGNDLPGAEAALSQAAKDWSKNELATRLKTELDAAKKIAAAKLATAGADALADAKVLPPAAATQEKPAAPVAEAVGEAKPFLLTPAGAITVLVIVALLIAAYSVFKKIKAKSGEVLE